ncbi:MAG: hypothetical protein AMXMBFR59_22010 [Rhodanobacteraceae bacterium]
MPQSAVQCAAAVVAPRRFRLPDGRELLVRRVEARDVALERAFLARLDQEGHAYCFLGLIKESDDEVARELIAVDPDCEVSLIALLHEDGTDIEVGLARLRGYGDGSSADCAVAVDPEWRRGGVGSRLLQRLVDVARERGVRRLFAADGIHGNAAHRFAERHGFRSCADPDDPAAVILEREL